MSTVGGAISGYCATGRSSAETRPAMTMMIAMTPANTGRWMKNFDKLARLLRRGRRHGGVGPQAREVVDDHPLARLQAFEHHPVVAGPVAGADRPLHRFPFRRGEPDEAAAFVLLHRLLRHDDRLLGSRREVHSHELAGQELE